MKNTFTKNYAFLLCLLSFSISGWGQSNATVCATATTIYLNQMVSGSTNNATDNFQVGDYKNCFNGDNTLNPFTGLDKIYRFQLSSTTNVAISLTGLSKDLDLFLIDNCNNFNCLASSLSAYSTSEAIYETLPAGTYYLIIDGYKGSEKSNFNLEVAINDNIGNAACPYPKNLRITDKGYSFVKILWDYYSANDQETRIREKGGNWIYGGLRFGLGTSWSGLRPCTTYEIQIRNKCGFGNGATLSHFSPSVYFTTDGCDDAYCYSSGLTYSWNNWIDRVAFNTFNHYSGNNLGYGNFTNVETTVKKSETYGMWIYPGYEWFGRFNVGYRVWIDFNQDNDFDDAGENVAATYHNNGQILKLNIEIPASAKSGRTRMRIASNQNRLPNPCDTGEYSEVEDYTLNIINASSTAKITVNTNQNSDKLKAFPNPAQKETTITFNSPDNTTVGIELFDVTGKVVYRSTEKATKGHNSLQLSLEAFPNGAYWVRLGSVNNYPPVKIMLQK